MGIGIGYAFFLFSFVVLLAACGKHTHKKHTEVVTDTTQRIQYDTISSLAVDLPDGDYIFKSSKGGFFQLKVSNDLDSVNPYKNMEADVFARADSKTCNTDSFEGSERAKVKTNKSKAPLEKNVDAETLFKALAKTEKKDCADRHTFQNATRKLAENRNVQLKTVYLYTFKRQADEDYHLIVGSTSKLSTAYFFNVEISGEPPVGAYGRTEILQARADFEQYFDIEEACARTYYTKDFRKNPIPISIMGSLFFDAHHCKAFQDGGPQKWTNIILQTAWEIHPITQIEFLK